MNNAIVDKLIPRCTIDKATLAHLKDTPLHVLSSSSSSVGVGSGVRSATSKFLGGGNGSRALSFVRGNGGSKSSSGIPKVGSLRTSYTNNNYTPNSNFDRKGTYLIFNVGDAIFVTDLNSQDKVLFRQHSCNLPFAFLSLGWAKWVRAGPRPFGPADL